MEAHANPSLRTRLHSTLSAGRCAVNAWLSVPSSYLAEGMSHQGFDSVTVDLQHGMIGYETAIAMLQGITAGKATPLVRVDRNDPSAIMHLLDAGAWGVVCPMIASREDAERFVSACRYPPRGTRSFGPARGLLAGGGDYFSRANDEILAIPMIEQVSAVDNIDDILSVPGVEMVYVGANDLSLDFGETPCSEPEGTKASKAIEHVLERVRAHGKKVGIFCSGPEAAAERRAQGFDLVTPGNDFGTLMRAARAAIKTVNA